MNRTLVLVALLLLSLSSLAWAEGPATTGPGPAGGRCVLPDLSRLSPDQAAAAVIQAGFEVSTASSPTTTVPDCPSTFRCSDIEGCGASMACFGFGIGPCCKTGGGAIACCGSNILVVSCPCQCVFEDCPHQCGQSSQLTWSCS